MLAPGNYDLLVSAVGNLLDNAIRYTPGGGKVVVKLEKSGDQTEVLVAFQKFQKGIEERKPAE